MRKGFIILLIVVLSAAAASADNIDLSVAADNYMLSGELQPILSPVAAVLEAGRSFAGLFGKGADGPSEESFSVLGLGVPVGPVTPWVGWGNFKSDDTTAKGLTLGVNGELWVDNIGVTGTLAVMKEDFHAVARLKYKFLLATAHIGVMHNTYLDSTKLMAGVGIHY